MTLAKSLSLTIGFNNSGFKRRTFIPQLANATISICLIRLCSLKLDANVISLQGILGCIQLGIQARYGGISTIKNHILRGQFDINIIFLALHEVNSGIKVFNMFDDLWT